MRYVFAFTFLLGFLGPIPGTAQELMLYVLNRGGDNILATPFDALNDSLSVKFDQNLLSAYDFVIDPLSSNLYWTNTISHQIIKAEIGVIEPSQAFDVTVSIPIDLEVDLTNKKIYWADNLRHQIFRSNLDGTEQETLPVDSVANLSAIALYPAQNKLFYAGLDSSTIWVSNLDGTDSNIFLNKELTTPVRLLIDTIQQKLYWSDDGQNRIERINLDGSEREVVYQGGDSEFPFGLLIDQINGLLLWTDYGTDQVMMSKLDGSEVAPIISSGLKDPMALLIVKEDGQRPNDRQTGGLYNEVEPSIAVYPNPATNALVVSSLVLNQNIETIRILDWTGRTVFSVSADEATLLIDTSMFPPGQYIYAVTVVGKQLSGLFSIAR